MLATAQHAWEDTFLHDEKGRALAPRFHRLLMLDVVREPTATDVQRLETNLHSLEERFDHGPAGLLTCLGWGPGWFERHTSLPAPRRTPAADGRMGGPGTRGHRRVPAPCRRRREPAGRHHGRAVRHGRRSPTRAARGPTGLRRSRARRSAGSRSRRPLRRSPDARLPLGPARQPGGRGRHHGHRWAARGRNDHAGEPHRARPPALVRPRPRRAGRAHVLSGDHGPSGGRALR